MSEQQPTSNKKKKWNTRGFYIALSVCLVAAGAAAWTTYDSITSNINHADTGNQTSQAASVTPGEKQVGQTVSGILTSSTPAKESAPSSSKEEKSSAPSSSSKPVSSATKEKAEGAASASSKSAALTVTEPTSFTYPLGKEVSKAYSGENLVYSETMQDWRAHQGTDFKASKGDAVHAMADGTVKKIYDDVLLGHVVVITHGSVEASYCGLNDAAPVKVNDIVKEGQEIGTIGTVPMEGNEGAHLHLELMKNGKWLDPLSILKESK